MATDGLERVLHPPGKRCVSVEDGDMSLCGPKDDTDEPENTTQQRTRVCTKGPMPLGATGPPVDELL